MTSKVEFKKIIEELVAKFDRNIDRYKDQSSSFNETQLRIEFIDPMFEALGWDMNNKAGAAEQYKEVIHEDKVYIEGKPKAPDYSFKFWGERKFFLEAKQPFVKIKTDYKPALQLRRYAWSAHLPVSILSDFEELAIYDTTIEPKATDKASVARLQYYKYTDYLDKWEEIYDLFAKESIQQGSFDKFIAKEKRGSQLVDKVFLKEIENWREWLAKDIAKHNSELTVEGLNFAVQKIIDRIIFLRIAEDRGIEVYKTLEKIIKSKNSYKELVRHFKIAHDKYNSGLFDFKEDTITPELKVSDKLLDKILEHLYYPNSPYEFSVLGVELLGSIYEQFLGKVIRLTAGHNAKIEEKPEVKKAGGVFYTPQYIVEYIVKNTVGELLKDKSIKQAEKIKVLDPACGSGSFLIGAYEFLLNWHLAEYEKLGDKEKEKLEKKGVIYKIVNKESTGKSIESWQLTTNEKKRIMLNNIYGVDIDSQAVEVTKLSLALKMLENENQQSINKQMKLFAERILPDMSGNIKCGNSLVGSDYWIMDKGACSLADATEEDIKKVNAFDWHEEFSDIFVEKALQAHMVTWVTHNSRVSERMVKYGVKRGESIWLENEAEKVVTKAIAEVVEKDNIPVLAYNICEDHVHMVIVSSEDDLPKIVQKLKSASAREHNIWAGWTVSRTREHAPLPTDAPLSSGDAFPSRGKSQAQLWAQKFHRKVLKDRLEFQNAINYIEQNRLKHDLPENKGVYSLAKEMIMSEEQAFSPQYKGGFDAVIGNPPYVRQELLGEYKPYFEKVFKTYAGTADLYTYFIEMGVDKLINKNGVYSIIVANKWMRAKYGKALREFLKDREIRGIIDFGDLSVFENATTYPCIITVGGGKATKSFEATNAKTLDFLSLEDYIQENKITVDQSRLDVNGWSIVDVNVQDLIDKLSNSGTTLGEYVDGKIYYGIKTGLNEAFVIDEDTKDRLIKEDPKSAEIIKPFLAGRDIKRYMPPNSEKYLILFEKGWTNSQGNFNSEKDAWDFISSGYPAISKFLKQFETKAKKRYDKGEYWWELRACDYYEEFEKEKIIYPNICKQPEFTFDKNSQYTNQKCFIIPGKDFFLLGILNSTITFFWFKMILPSLRGDFFEPSYAIFKNFPIATESKDLELVVETQLANHKILAQADSESKKQLIQKQIDATDEKINGLVYKLYNLTDEEIEIIENAT